jgi:hypothetical protein
VNADEYRVYLRSERWRYTREWALRMRGHRCEACGSAHALEVHHRTYHRLGAELVHDTQHDRRILLAAATDVVTATADTRLIALTAADEPVKVIDVLPTWMNQMQVVFDNDQDRRFRLDA